MTYEVRRKTEPTLKGSLRKYVLCIIIVYEEEYLRSVFIVISEQLTTVRNCYSKHLSCVHTKTHCTHRYCQRILNFFRAN